MDVKSTLLFVVGMLALVAAAPGSAREKRSPQLPPLPQPPAGIPMPPGMLEEAMATIARFSRQAEPKDAPPPPSSRVVRQAPEDAPPPPSRVVRQTKDDAPKRIARQAVKSEMEKPQHIRQEAFYSSMTSMSRKKRGSAVNGEAEIRV